jgi:hypothetical protein
VTTATGGCYVCQNVPASSHGFLVVINMYYVFERRKIEFEITVKETNH